MLTHLLSKEHDLDIDFSCLPVEKIPQESSHTVNCDVSTDHDEPRQQEREKRITLDIWGDGLQKPPE